MGAAAAAALVFVAAALGLERDAQREVAAEASRPRLVAPPPSMEIDGTDPVVLTAQSATATATADEDRDDADAQLVVVPTVRKDDHPTNPLVVSPLEGEDVAPLEEPLHDPLESPPASSSRRIPEAAVPTLVAPGLLAR